MGRKKKKKGAPAPALGGLPPLPPPPGAAAAIPPPPPNASAAIPPPPPPSGDAIPPPPADKVKPAKGILEGSSAPTISGLAPPDMSKEKKKDGYDSLWKRGSSKPLQQVYGHIDRLGEGEVGSLLDRYADRFGHQLDREIIVKRKAEHDSKIAEIRDAPTIELLDDDEFDEIEEEVEEEIEEEPSIDDEDFEEEPEDDGIELEFDEQTLDELNARKGELEANIKKLKPKYQLAKQKNQASKLKKLKPRLEQLINEHKSIKAVILGEMPLSSLDVEEEEEVQHDESDIFAEFVSIVDNLLAKLPDPDAFIRSDSFELYATVAGDPANADDNDRAEFFAMVDSLLLELPEDEIKAFTQSEEFAVYSEAGSQYGS